MLIDLVAAVIALGLMVMAFLPQTVCPLTASTTQQYGVGRCDKYRNHTVDCRHKSLGHIPNETFPVSTTRLDLSFNKIRIVYGFTFHLLVQLVWLDLSNNGLYKLERHAFQNLHQLDYLNLNTNELNVASDIFPKGLFKPLQALKVFHFEDNQCRKNSKHAYPLEVANLTNLVELYTDFPHYVQFGKAFVKLARLEKISSSGFSFPNRRHMECCVRQIYNTSFTALSHSPVRSFQLSHSCLKEIQADAFIPFQRLDVLKLNGNKQLGLFSILQTFHGLQHKHFSYVSLSQSNTFLNRHPRDFITGNYNTRFLRTTCIKSLDVSKNFLVLKARIVFSRVDCLEEFDMSLHSCDTEMLFRIWVRQKFYPNLKVFNISRAVLGDPAEAQTVSMEHFVSPNRSLLPLRVFDASFIPMTCDYENIQFRTLSSLNISGWNCSAFQKVLFWRATNLTHLSIRQAQLNKGFSSQPPSKYRQIFINQHKLEWLDLSGNELTYIPDDLLLTTSRLRVLSLHNNKLTTVPSHVFGTTALTTLDLSSNAMQQLTNKEIQIMQAHRGREKAFRVLLASNPWVCSCDTLAFLQWLNQTDLVADFGRSFLCRVSNGSEVRIVEFMKTFNDFSVACVSNEWLKIGIVCLLLVIPLILGALFYYRRRYNIHYWFYSNCKPSEDMLPKRNYDYDAFVAYNQNDGNWVHYDLLRCVEDEYGLRLCVHQRNFPAGEPIHQNIVDSINSSRKILLVISNQFVRSTWGEYEIEMAAMRSVQEGRSNVIVCVMLEEIPVKSMPRSLLNLWHRVTFLEWPGSEGDQAAFWSRLGDALR